MVLIFLNIQKLEFKSALLEEKMGVIVLGESLCILYIFMDGLVDSAKCD